VNITDDDGDTPLYTVETIEAARYLVEKGALVDRVNEEGVSVRPRFQSETRGSSQFFFHFHSL